MGMHGWKHVNRAIQSADLLIADRHALRRPRHRAASRPTPRMRGSSTPTSTRPRSARTWRSRSRSWATPSNVLEGLTKLVHAVDPADRAEYLAQLEDLARGVRGLVVARLRPLGASSTADYVVERIGELTDHVATYVADVGQNQMWLARYTKFRRPHSHISSGGLGTMGFAVPAAMGAALGNPDAETWAVCGDGGFQMTSQELMTLAADRIPVKIALLDNKKLGMIRQWQELVYAGNYHSSHLPGPDFVKLAEAYGIPAFKVARSERGRRRDPRRAGGRRARAHLVRDRAGAERVPDDAGGQGPVRPDRAAGARGMSPDPDGSRARTAPPTPPSRSRPTGRFPAAARRSATSWSSSSWTGRACSTASPASCGPATSTSTPWRSRGPTRSTSAG